MHSVIPTRFLTPVFFERYGVGEKMSLFKKLSTVVVTKLIGLLSSAVVVHKEVARKELVESYGFQARKITIIPHGVASPTRGMDPQLCRNGIGIDGGPVVTFFGFVRPGKGIEDAFEAMPELLERSPGARLVVAGGCHAYLTREGQDYFRKLEALADQLQLRESLVLTKRFLTDDELPLWFGATDVFLLPYAETEIIGSSGVLATVAGYGKPVVVTDVYRFSEVKEEGMGLVVPKGDARSFGREINLLLSDEPLRRKLGLRLSMWAEKNSWTEVARRTLDLYREVADGGSQKGGP